MTVYLDELFLVNFLMDWLILWATGNMAQIAGKRGRLIAAAFLGACYSIAVFLPHAEWLQALPIKIGCSLGMLYIAFPFIRWRNYLKSVIYFYLISFVLGGASIAAMFLFGQYSLPTWNGVALVQIDFQLFWLIVAASLVLGVIFFLRHCLRQDIAATPEIVTVQISFQERQVTLRLLLDTGNHLTDPLSGQPVIVAEQSSLLPLFSPERGTLLQETKRNAAELLLMMVEQEELTGYWRLIPYQAVGQRGMLLGFRPDRLILQHGEENNVYTNVIVALSEQKFSPYGTYQGLVQPELF